MNHRLGLFGLLGMVIGSSGSVWAAPMTRVVVEVTGGPSAGSYTQASPETFCTAGRDSWRTTLHSAATESPATDSPGADPGGLSIFMLAAPSLETFTDATDDFSLVLGFGEYGDDTFTEYVLEPAKGSGTGSLTFIQSDRKHAQLTVTGQTAEGVTLNATLTCDDILDISGRSLSATEFGELKFAPDAVSPTGSLALAIGEKSYAIKTGEEGSCTRGMAEAGDLWYEYYADEGHTDLLLMTNEVERAKSGTSTFGLSIDLSPIHEPGDAGTLTVTEDGERLTLLADAQTSDGIPVQVTVVCPLP